MSDKNAHMDHLESIESNSLLAEGTTTTTTSTSGATIITPRTNEEGNETLVPTTTTTTVLIGSNKTPLHQAASSSSSAAATTSTPTISNNSMSGTTIQPSLSYVSPAISSTTGTPSITNITSPFTTSSQTQPAQQQQQQQQQQAPTTNEGPQQQPPPHLFIQHPPSPKQNTSTEMNMMMSTIENPKPSPRNSFTTSGIARKDSEDSAVMMNIPPAHPFFHQQLAGLAAQYDSDGSDGSFVQKRRRPSFDNSVTSSGGGSIKRVASSSEPPSPVRQSSNPFSFPPHQQHQPVVPVNPQMLPYHERRKLMMQRQKQPNQQPHQPQQQMYSQFQQQQQQQQQHPPSHRLAASDPNFRCPTPPNPTTTTNAAAATAGGIIDLRLMAPDLSSSSHPQQQHPHQHQHQQYPSMPLPQYAMDPAQLAAYMNLYGMPPPMPPPMGYYGYPPPPQGYPGYPPPPAGAAAAAAAQGYPNNSSSTGGHPAPPHQPPAGMVGTAPYGYPPPPPQQHYGGAMMLPQHPPSSSTASEVKPNGNANNIGSSNSNSNVQPRLSPYQSIGKQAPQPPLPLPLPFDPRRPPIGQRPPVSGKAPPPLSHQQQRLFPTPPSSGADNSTAESSRPPPPPPLPTSMHVHSDSMGSMSSLGSSYRRDAAPNLNSTTPLESPATPSSGHKRKTSSGSFLDMLREQWTPTQPPPPEPTVSEFRRKNQEFLNRNMGSPRMHRRMPSPQQHIILPHQQQQPHHHRRRSEDRPPASRGTHKRLPSITNDDWEDHGKEQQEEDSASTGRDGGGRGTTTPTNMTSRELVLSSGGYSSSSELETEDRPRQYNGRTPFPSSKNKKRTMAARDNQNKYSYYGEEGSASEQTSLLPPPGISTNEQDGAYRGQHLPSGATSSNSRPGQYQQYYPDGSGGSDLLNSVDRDNNLASTERWDNRKSAIMLDPRQYKSSRKGRKKKSKRKHKSSRRMQEQENLSDDMSSDSNYDYRQWTQKRARMLEKERAKLIAQWKAEAKEEAETSRRGGLIEGNNRLTRKWGEGLEIWWSNCSKRLLRFAFGVETFIANLPLTIGAVAMAVVTLGVVWFKFAEENLPGCEPVQFHSSQCTFPEFPGCFYCDTKADMYRLALGFHYACKISAGILAMLFVLKILFSARVVMDEMSSPTTASPAGLLCMTTVCVFAGHGSIGQFMVTAAAGIHFCLALWFVYMALAYRIMPDPSWFPNTVGVGLSAVKTWLYYPMPGHLLMAVSLASNFFFFPISLLRVAINDKISATVGWMQMSAPAISLYALTIMAQPSFEQEHPDVTRFQRVHRMVYLPCMHVMAALSVLGFLASCHSLWRRWHDFRKREFSPAHAAFCFPVLSHANAMQAYRGAIISFSQIDRKSWRMIVLYVYWFTVLMGGTIATIWVTARFLYCLPRWTNLDLTDEEEPPAPNETIIAMRDMVTAGETMRQPFVSPAVLQANETGALVLARSGPGGALRYVRTRRMLSLGFEPTMNWNEMQEERDVLLDWVGKHPPRRRHRTLSVPGLDFSYGSRIGTGNSGVYGAVGGDWSQPPRRRADTESPRPAYY